MVALRRGDFVWVDFDPQAEHEQTKRRPALVLSPDEYNKRSNLILVLPITSKRKNYPFEVVLPDNLAVSGSILTDQIKNIDPIARKCAYCGHIPNDILAEVLAKVHVLTT
ncbi:MAG: type II toxin-antitoxin system PemK/MazF family toxin [Pseudomonadota bacterium]